MSHLPVDRHSQSPRFQQNWSTQVKGNQDCLDKLVQLSAFKLNYILIYTLNHAHS